MSKPNLRLLLCFLALCTCLAGCRDPKERGSAETADQASADSEADAAKIDEATAAAERFFSFVAAGDCDELLPLFAEAKTRDQCEEYVLEMQAHGVGLVRVDKCSVDGRDPNAVIVHAILTKQGAEVESLVRVVHRGDGWKIAY